MLKSAYHVIEDVWLGMAQKIVYIKEIPPINIIDDLRVLAAEDGALSTLKLLCDPTITSPRKKAIEIAFSRAVSEDQIEVAAFLCTLTPKIAPSPAFIVKEFKSTFRKLKKW